MKNVKACGAILLFFVSLALVVFRCGLGSDHVFSGSDANIGLLMAAKRHLPQSFTGGFSSFPVLGDGSFTPLSVANIGQWLLSPSLYSDAWYSVYLLMASLALVGYLRLWGIRWSCAVFGSVSAFWVGSITMSAAGHMTKLGVMAFFSLGLLLLEAGVRARGRARVGYALSTGLCVGLMLLEQQDVGLLAGLFLGVYALFRLFQTDGGKWLGWIQLLVPIAVVALALSATTALYAYASNVTETGLQENPTRQWSFVTQWSMVPRELPDLVAPGYTGWSTGNPDGPYWGECGQSMEWKTTGQGFRNFRLDNLYLGVLPVCLALAGVWFAVRTRRAVDGRGRVFCLWGGLGLLAILLAFGKYSPLYRLFYHLPLMGNIRAPIKFMQNFQVIVGLMAAFGLDGLVGRGNGGKRSGAAKWAAAACAGLAFAMLVLALSASQPGAAVRFSQWGQYASVIADNIAKAWGHAAAMGALLCAAMFILSRPGMPRAKQGVVPLLILAVAFDSVYLTGKYFHSQNIRELKAGNPVIDYLKQHQGHDRVFCFSQQGAYNVWISQDFFFHGINVFNFGQMPRMPADYKAFFDSIGGDWHRMVQLTSCRYGLAPAGIYAQLVKSGQAQRVLRPIMYFRFAIENGQVGAQSTASLAGADTQVLFEFMDSLPRISLFPDWEIAPDDAACARLADPAFNPKDKVLLSGATAVDAAPSAGPVQEVSIKQFGVSSVGLEADSPSGGIVLFTQHYQPGWTVEVDGSPATILRCNFLDMGAYVPAGRHSVVFHCPRQGNALPLQIATIAASLIGAVALTRRRNAK